MKKFFKFLLPMLLVCLTIFGIQTANTSYATETANQATTKAATQSTINLNDIPAYTGNPYVALNNNQPSFVQSDYTIASFETYSDLDNLGRCGAAYANVDKNLMPTEKRGSIGQVKPTGWHTIKYDNISGNYLYNRCHLIAYELTAENANEKNLITGTRYMNIEGMLPFENMVTDYINETGNHVLYRVTPIFNGNELVARGVHMEGFSVEDKGEGICYNVFVYNIQPDITIDYATGESSLADTDTAQAEETTGQTQDANQSNAGNTSDSSKDASVNESEELKRIDTNHNGKVTIAEAEAAGYSMPIYESDWLYKYMTDRDHDGMVGE